MASEFEPAKLRYLRETFELAKIVARQKHLRGGAIFTSSLSGGPGLVIQPIDMGYKEQSALRRWIHTGLAMASFLSLSAHKGSPSQAEAADLNNPQPLTMQSDEGATLTVIPHSGGEACGEDGSVFLFDRDVKKPPEDTGNYQLQADLMNDDNHLATLSVNLPTTIDGICVYSSADTFVLYVVKDGDRGAGVEVDAP